MTNIIPSVIQDNGEYYIHMEEYKKVKELGEHYKHLYSEVKQQKDDAIEFIKYNEENRNDNYLDLNNHGISVREVKILRMLGEIDE